MKNVPYLEASDINSDGSLLPHVGKGKPVVLLLQTNGCPHCTRSKPDFEKFANNCSTCVGATIQLDVDRDAAQSIAPVNQSPGVPAYLGFDKNGKFVKTHTGNRDSQSLQQFASTL